MIILGYLLLSIFLILLLTSKLKIHPTISLFIGSFFLGLLLKMNLHDILEYIFQGFSNAIKSIGLIIIFSTIIGQFLKKSNSIKKFGDLILYNFQNKTLISINLLGLFLGTVVFCDSGFLILNGISKSIASTTNYSLTSLNLSLSGGLYASHTLVPPTPGPLAAINNLNGISMIGDIMLLSIVVSIPASLISFIYARKTFGKLNLKIKSQNLKSRPPIVTVMGHVDHGKTSVLDVLRKANVVSGEFGGITQHLGAYQINYNTNKITFIDTPGHAAFTEMRARGSKLTDLVILVVAADDGVKPQTVESIKHAKAAKVPIVVAINKCDLPEADPQKIKNQLLEHELIAEDLSGDTLMVEISTKTKNNLDKLIESVLLQAELLDLKTDYDLKANGVVMESKIDVGRGPIVNIIVTSGTLKKGDYFVSGLQWGKIRALINDQGLNINEAIPSSPVEVLGINRAAKAGDDFVVVDNEKEAKSLCEARIQESKIGKNPLIFATQDSAFKDKISEELNIIIKSDVHGSSEAIKNTISQIKHDEVKPIIMLSDIGMITETDVSLAKASNAVLIAFNVKPSKEAKKLAEKEKIEINSYNIIYELLDFIKNKMSGLLTPDVKEKIIGSAEILEIFKVSKVGKVAGSKVTEGEILQDSNARVIRDGTIIFNGKIGSIFREQNQAKQVSAGLECGITIKNFNDFQKKDIIEVYNSTITERTI